jgi:hypothetical protein
MQNTCAATGLKVTTRTRAGKLATNHNNAGVKVASKVRGGRIAMNHNQSR